MQTAQFFVDFYRWYPISPTMHKVLIPDVTVIDHVIMPIDQLSEEATKVRNEHFLTYL